MVDLKAFYGLEDGYFEGRGCGFTSREIAQQPSLWRALAVSLAERKGDIDAFIESMGGLGRMRIVFTGAGSSAFVGDALAALLGKAGAKAESIPTTDIVSAPGSFLFGDVPTLLVSFARSGNSPESVGAVGYARAMVKDLYEAAIVCSPDSALCRYTAESGRSLTLLMPEGSNDKGFAMTSSVSCMMLAGFALIDRDAMAGLAKGIGRLADSVSSSAAGLAKAAASCADMDFDRLVYLGSGFMKHLAHEASLKAMELTNGRVNASFESPVGFRHGPKSVINDRTMTVHMISSDPFTERYDADLLQEVYGQKKRNTVVAVHGGEGGGLPSDVSVEIPGEGFGALSDICTGLEALVFCQMLAMFKSLSLGVNTDDPSPTGEVNRVVKGVRIYDIDGLLSQRPQDDE